MGTRADFYMGRGKSAEWIGSIAYDGYPSGIKNAEGENSLVNATNELEFRTEVANLLLVRQDATIPEEGFPWPWDDSALTDYVYAFEEDRVFACRFGKGWFEPLQEPESADGFSSVEFPHMKDIQNVKWGVGSGLMLLSL